MDFRPIHFIGVPVEVSFSAGNAFTKKPACPAAFFWDGQEYRVRRVLNEWTNYRRRGRVVQQGSWGVGRTYFRVEVGSGKVFDLYYDRAPKDAQDRQGSWYLFQELGRI